MRLVVFIHRATGLQVMWEDERCWWTSVTGAELGPGIEAAPPRDVDCIILESYSTPGAPAQAWLEVARCACTPFCGMADSPAQAFGEALPA